MKNTAIGVFVIAILAIGIFYFSNRENNNLENNPIETNEDLTDVSEINEKEDGYSEYESKDFGLSFLHPNNFTIREEKENNSPIRLGSIYASFTKYDSERGKPVDCGGLSIQPDEVVVSINVYSETAPYMKDYSDSSITLGNKTMEVKRNIGGVCEDVDGYLWRLENGNIIEFYVHPSSTEYLDEAEKIIASVDVAK